MRSLVFGVTLSALDRVTTLLLEIWQRFDTSSVRCQAITGHTHCDPIRTKEKSESQSQKYTEMATLVMEMMVDKEVDVELDWEVDEEVDVEVD